MTIFGVSVTEFIILYGWIFDGDIRISSWSSITLMKHNHLFMYHDYCHLCWWTFLPHFYLLLAQYLAWKIFRYCRSQDVALNAPVISCATWIHLRVKVSGSWFSMSAASGWQCWNELNYLFLKWHHAALSCVAEFHWNSYCIKNELLTGFNLSCSSPF